MVPDEGADDECVGRQGEDDEGDDQREEDDLLQGRESLAVQAEDHNFGGAGVDVHDPYSAHMLWFILASVAPCIAAPRLQISSSNVEALCRILKTMLTITLTMPKS